MKINVRHVASATYLSFAFDSLLKVSAFGFQFHAGIIAVLLFNFIYLLGRPQALVKMVSEERSIFFFLGWCLASALLFLAPAANVIVAYLLMAMNVMLFVAVTFRRWDSRIFLWFQWVMILTGLLQFLAFKLFGVQISFIDEAHYQKGFSVTHRLRGFFVEPNWFAISFAFNTLLLMGPNLAEFARRHKSLIALTVVVMLLNGSLATLVIVVIALSVPYLKTRPLKATLALLLGLGVSIGGLAYRDSLSEQEPGVMALNYGSRWEPIVRVLTFQRDAGPETMLLGRGLGSWGTEAIYERLSVLTHEERTDARDSSEFPVVLFELGILGALLLALDGVLLFRRAHGKGAYVRGGIVLFAGCLVFYPILKFWMYMPYYFYLRRIARASSSPS
jgi:hypothetical protein